ncbi:MAG: hypothetical protein SPI77_05120 [Corynebacterium sp.]|nr:hypothetical protein [Corynebacterium sp.]
MRTNDEMARAFETMNGGSGPDILEELDPKDLIAIMAAKSAQTRAEEEMILAVRRARSHGFSWRQIGDVLHITRQAAHSRFAHKVGEAAA